MSVALFSVMVATLGLGASMLVRRSPFAYETRAPTKQWADQPMKLVATPPAPAGKGDLVATSAAHMALLHNALIRGYNSIVVQAPHVRAEDKADFVPYAKTWLRFITSHHDDEEDVLFPEIKSMLGDGDVLGDMYKEHESFLDGLKQLGSYLDSLPSASALAPSTLVDMMDSFREPLQHHMHHEVSVMAAMATHPNAPVRDSPSGTAAAKMLKAWGRNTVRKAGLADVVPFFLLNVDRTAEGGAWRDWPPMPRPIRWAMVNLVGAAHGGWWRFASCDAQGQPRELYTLTAGHGEEKSKL